MKRFLLMVLTAVLVFAAFGCTEKEDKEEVIAANDVFTDGFFEDLEQISLMGLTGPVSGEEMEKAVELLKNVSLAPAGDYLPEEEDPVLLILRFGDGTTKTVSVSSVLIAFNEIGAGAYLIEDENFFADFIKAFGVGEE